MSSFDRREEREDRVAGEVPATSVRAAGREADRRARLESEELHMIPGPGLDDEQQLREKMDEISPDGRPPTVAIHREARRLFFLALTVAAVVVLVAIYAWGGIGPTAVALVLWGLFIGLAAWPTWHAAIDRRMDVERSRKQLGVQRGTVSGRETDRRVSGG
jgi:hypothetical protein